jgi:hypothetical protein
MTGTRSNMGVVVVLGILGWLWYRQRSGQGIGQSLNIGRLGSSITNEDNSGSAVSALGNLLAGTSGRRVALNTPNLNLTVADPAGEFQALVESHCTGDPRDGFCREPGTLDLLNRFSYRRTP